MMDNVSFLEQYPNVTIASNGSWLETKQDNGSAGEDE